MIESLTANREQGKKRIKKVQPPTMPIIHLPSIHSTHDHDSAVQLGEAESTINKSF
jgi:hypothetical protein